ncbi:recombinase family protein [Thermicanus aegyptius]|uniref:recombinase family protein n=1 Tax=Thermicanus aegyptius TaxID=94009 RepID=UPI000587992F|nr:recombinase family protein [Thermicanus aegyptius]
MKVAIYARVSSEDQQERGTIGNQTEFAQKYCDLHQLDVLHWYLDDGISGTIPLEEREEGKKLLEDAKAGKIDLLLIYRLDRLGRSARIILNAVYDLEQNGVKIRSMTEPFDTGDPSGRFLLTILAGVADLERETILERMWLGANRAARSGKWLGGIVPYGYRVNKDGFIEVNEDFLPGFDMSEADVIRLIYRLVGEQGMSTIKLADYLNALGIPPSYVKDARMVTQGKRKVATSGIWLPGRIRNMIVNTTYKGIHYYGKRTNKKRELIKREVPAIVSEELWQKAQDALKQNQIEAMRNSKRKYLLRGLIKCGVCGLTYHGSVFGKELKAFYLCGGKTSYHGPFKEKCVSKNVPAEWVEELVWNDCVNFIRNPGSAMMEMAATFEERTFHKKEILAELESVKKALNEKEEEKQSILDLYRRKLIGSTDVEIQLQRISKEKDSLELRIADLENELRLEDGMAKQFFSVEELLKDLRSKIEGDPPFEVKREIIKTLVKEVVVHTIPKERGRPNATVTVHFTFSKDVPRTDRDSSKRLT